MKYAIEIKKLTKRYKIFSSTKAMFKQVFSRKKHYRDFYALRDVTMNIPHGSTIGIIGKNGAGKSTLLKMISGVTAPTSGVVTVNGRISSLLELGTGFNPEFTGIENIYLNAAFLNIPKSEIEKRIDNIKEFADIGEHIDQPLKSYSSGMKARLGFAIAINVDPDILIVDEALSVGDVFFQQKCYKKFNEFRDKGVTILFVTHALAIIKQYCDYAYLLNEGELKYEGTPDVVINEYYEVLGTNSEKRIDISHDPRDSEIIKNPLYNKYSTVKFSDEIIIKNMNIYNVNSKTLNSSVLTGDDLIFSFQIGVFKEVKDISFIFSITAKDGSEIISMKKALVLLNNNDIYIKISFKNVLNSGDYFISTKIEKSDDDYSSIIHYRESCLLLKVLQGKSLGIIHNFDMKIIQFANEPIERLQKKDVSDPLNIFKNKINYTLPVFLVTFPISGSAFFQHILEKSIGIKSQSMYGNWDDVFPDDCLSVKSHAFSPGLLMDECSRYLRKKTDKLDKVIILLRDPRDTLISFYEFFKRRRKVEISQKDFLNNVDFFYATYTGALKVLDRKVEFNSISILDAFELFHKNWINSFEGEKLIVNYEDLFLKKDLVETQLSEFLSVDFKIHSNILNDYSFSNLTEIAATNEPYSWKKIPGKYSELIDIAMDRLNID